MPNDFSDFNKIYNFLSPSDLSSAIQKMTGEGPLQDQKTSMLDKLMSMFLSPNGDFYKATKIKEDIEREAKNDDNSPEFIHIIGTQDIGTIKLKKQDDKLVEDDYWQSVKKLEDISDNIGGTNKIPVTAVVSRSPFFTPGRRGTREVEMFLNYIPTIMASQLVPFLDVEFELIRGNSQASVLSTPSSLRFLLGSVNMGESEKYAITDADKAMLNVRNDISSSTVNGNAAETITKTTAYSGMEMFLSPQTLTNMDNLGDTTARLTPVKPFLPFMSIEDFQVTINNAGAGAMVHRSANLKLKIHDKNRLSEISEFIRGPVGFRQAVIWTTYGWIAPRSSVSEDEDGYAKFINENMASSECWQTKNTQFNFDATGQVSLSIELVSKGMQKLQGATMSFLPGSKLAKFEELKNIIEEITNIKDKINYDSSSDAINTEIRSSQLLNAGATGAFPKIENINTELLSLKNSLALNGSLDAENINILSSRLETLYKPSTSDKDKHTFLEALSSDVNTSITKIFTDISAKPDPFIPKTTTNKYFNDKLVKIVTDFNGQNIPAEIDKNKDIKTKDFDKDKLDSMSFGKILLNTVIPAIVAQDTCDELQVIFYALNDQCGPIKGHSVAEFPIDVRVLEYAYKDYMETHASTGAEISVEEFFRMIVSTQFSDNRAIGYGMNDLYEVFNPDNKEAKKRDDKQFDSYMQKWLHDYGALKRPVIEMYVETSAAQSKSGKYDIFNMLQKSQKDIHDMSFSKEKRKKDNSHIIKRIHIYDKQNNPYKLLGQILGGKGEYSIGSINQGKIERLIAAAAAATAAGINATADQIKEKMANVVRSQGETAEEYKRRVDTALNNLEVVDKPGGPIAKIGKNRKAVMNAVSNTAPHIIIGANGSMITQASLASKTDGLQGAINIINSNKSNKQTGVVDTSNGLESPNGLPLRIVPAQLTMTSKGCPIASLYQQYFIDFGTGTTLDNLYNCTQLQHSIGPGKFDTSWTFAFTDGYGKFAGAPTIASGVTNQIDSFVSINKAKQLGVPKK